MHQNKQASKADFRLKLYITKNNRLATSHSAIASDVNKARTLKAKAKAVAIPMQRLTMKYEVMKSSFFRVLLQGYKHSLITSLITDMIPLRRNE